MDNPKLGGANITFEQALFELIRVQSLEFDSQYKPDIEGVKSWVLKRGPQSSKVAVYWSIRDRNTGLLHHHSLKLATVRKIKKQDAWIEEDEHSIALSDEKDGNEIAKLLDGLASVNQFAGESGQYVVINPHAQDDNRLRQILNAIATSGRKVDLLAEVLSWIDDDPRVTAGLIKLAAEHPIRSKSLAAGLNYGRYKQALDELKRLIETDNEERVYQRFLEENFWMFGSEYSELLRNRTLVKGNILDFPLRRTVDGYLDIIEIKRPQNGSLLFRKDKRSNLSETSELVEARAQAGDYLANIDAESYQIKYHEELDVEKVRAKIIIGRDGDEQQTRALRRLNAHTNRIEIITYDQLIRIAERIIGILGDEATLDEEYLSSQSGDNKILPPQDNIGDIPF